VAEVKRHNSLSTIYLQSASRSERSGLQTAPSMGVATGLARRALLAKPPRHGLAMLERTHCGKTSAGRDMCLVGTLSVSLTIKCHFSRNVGPT
jgi:hypothetical protein